ncbi:translocation/assembly module TamB domain-containing protein [Pendulispora albinea]|uniref:Translocation/assembly module TamB n=1 Tax=Pendulispora albinea TaxID=2741071 RepID=A0ABZ2LNB6_9BACT
MPGRLRRVLRTFGTVGVIVGTTATFAVATVGGALLHLNLPAARRVAAVQVNRALAGTFRGTLTIEHIGRIGPSGITNAGATLDDPEGKRVAWLDGVTVKVDLRDLVRSLLLEKGNIRIGLPDIGVDAAHVSLDTDPSGALNIARAFESANPSPPSEPPGRGVHVGIPNVVLHHVWVHGQMGGAPPIDADLDEVVGRVNVEPGLTIDVSHARLTARALPKGANPRGELTLHVDLPPGAEAELGLEATFGGDIAGVPATAHASMKGSRVDAVADIPHASKEQLRTLVPEVEWNDDAKVHAEAHGTLPQLAITADVGVGKAKLHATGDLRLGPTISAELAAEARDIDVRAFSPAGPASDLSADVKASIRLDEKGAPHGTYTVRVLPGEVAGQRVPAVRLGGKVEGENVTVRGHVGEVGAPTEIRASLGRHGTEPIVHFETHTHIDNLQGIARVGPIARGSADIHTRGNIVLGSPTIDARVDVDARGIEREGVALGSVHLGGRVTGELAKPFVDVNVEGHDLEAGGRHFSEVDVQVRGPVTAPVIGAVAHGDDETRLEIAAAVEIAGEDVTLRHVRLDVVEPEIAMVTRAKRIHIAKSGILVEDTVIEGLGEPTVVRAERNREGIRLRLQNKGLDIASVARLARLDPSLIRAGSLDCDVDLVVHPKGVDGTVVLDLKHAAVGHVEDAHADLRATFDDKHVIASAHAESAKHGTVDLDTSTLVLPGSPLDPSSWEKVIGKAHIESNLDIDELTDVLPATLPFRPVGGTLLVELDVGRDQAHEEPDLELSVRTEKLALVARTPPPVDTKVEVNGKPMEQVVKPPAWSLTGVDLALEAKIDGEDGKSQLSAKVVDAHASLLELEASGQLPYHKLVRSEMAGNANQAMAMLEKAPWSAKLTVPRRRLDSLPLVLGTAGLAGEVELTLRAEGTALEPRIALDAHTYDVKRQRGADYPATTVDLLAQYNAGKAQLGLSVRLPPHGGPKSATPVEVFALHGDGHVRASELLHPPAKGPAWDATAYAKIRSFPLESVAFFADRHMRGRLSGDFELKDLHRAATAHSEIRLDGLRVGRAEYTGVKVSTNIDDKGARTSLRFDQKDGFAQVDVRGRVLWGARVVPVLDRTTPIEAEVKANAFRVAAFLPFVQPQVSDLDGRIHADARVYLPPPTAAQAKGGPDDSEEGEERPTMEGNIVLSEGSVELPILGEKLQGLHANVIIDRGGRVRIEDIEARTDEGHLRGDASVRLAGVRLTEASANLEIPSNEAFPISLHGEELGEVYGKVEVRATADRKTTNVDVNVPELRFKLPDTSSHDVLELDRAEKIRVGVQRTPHQLTLLPLTPQEYDPPPPTPPGAETKLVIRTKLGHDVEIKRGTGLRVQMDGETNVSVNAETKMSGQIRLLGGTLEVQGKRFEIEKGTVTFTGDPTNPVASVTAGWTAPQGTRVYADFVGPIKTGKVNLRSEPSRSQNEILALILYGTDQSGTAPKRRAASATTQAVGMGGGFATQGLNKALEGLTGSDVVTVRLDTSSSANPRPEVEFQISRSISLQLATVFGRLPFDQPDRNLATIDWRFRRNWSVETTVGDKGSSMIDLIWQKRY